MLHDEFALVFHLDRNEVEAFIRNQIPEEKQSVTKNRIIIKTTSKLEVCTDPGGVRTC